MTMEELRALLTNLRSIALSIVLILLMAVLCLALLFVGLEVLDLVWNGGTESI